MVVLVAAVVAMCFITSPMLSRSLWLVVVAALEPQIPIEHRVSPV